jgi:hypothetical protein
MGAPDAMSTWHSLKKDIKERREEHRVRLTEVQASLIRRFKELASRGLCDSEVQGWFTTENGVFTISNAAPAKVGDWPAIPLKNLEHIDDAHLTLSVTIDRRSGLKEYSIQLCGTRRIASSPPWYARVDLDEEPKGVGLCSHALLHAHVGATPDSDDIPSDDPLGARKRFSTRVPMPWLTPIDALNWLLAAVDRRLEPAPNPST